MTHTIAVVFFFFLCSVFSMFRFFFSFSLWFAFKLFAELFLVRFCRKQATRKCVCLCVYVAYVLSHVADSDKTNRMKRERNEAVLAALCSLSPRLFFFFSLSLLSLSLVLTAKHTHTHTHTHAFTKRFLFLFFLKFVAVLSSCRSFLLAPLQCASPIFPSHVSSSSFMI